MLLASTLKGNLNSQKSKKPSWLVTTIKAILQTPIKKSENIIFLLRRIHEAAVRNRKILPAFKGGLGTEIAAHKDSLVNYGSELRDIVSLAKLFFHHKYKTKIINITQQ